MQSNRRVHPSAQRTVNWVRAERGPCCSLTAIPELCARGDRGFQPGTGFTLPNADEEKFAHIGVDQNQPKSTTSSAQNQVQNSKAAPYLEETLPLARKAREQTAVKNNFPFSFHDNKHCLQNVGEYFDFGLGRRKVEPERRQQNSQNFFQWAHEPVPSKEDGLTIYQTSFMGDKSSESTIYRRYPKEHTEKQCPEKPILEKDKNLQPNKSS
ncbi:testis-expressed protein 36 [Melopsittacus undulatus]|uniref:testis-expressed protein 36 n=1 Tax=Melopsittacus undulatus TaxID=13146 RepID=UPI00146A34F1|nr:testis-expressed protein 36 [Melopsittacus undulatus]